MSTITLGYSPNDFFYVDAESSGIRPTQEWCDSNNPTNITWDVKCSAAINPATQNTYFMDNSFNCIQKELCINMDNATKLIDYENRHEGSDRKYVDAKTNHDIVLLDVINLGIGIIFAIAVIYRNRNMK